MSTPTDALDAAKAEARLSVIRAFASLSPAERKEKAEAFGQAERLCMSFIGTTADGDPSKVHCGGCAAPLKPGEGRMINLNGSAERACDFCVNEADEEWRSDPHYRQAVSGMMDYYGRARGWKR